MAVYDGFAYMHAGMHAYIHTYIYEYTPGVTWVFRGAHTLVIKIKKYT